MRSPAELLFDGIGRGLSRVAAAADPDLPELLRESDGRTLALVVRGTDRVLEVEVQGGSLHVRPPRRVTGSATGAWRGADSGPEPTGEPRIEDFAAPTSAGSPDPLEPARSGAPGDDALGPDDASEPAERVDLLLSGSVPDFVRFLLAIRRDSGPEDPFAGLEASGSDAAREAFVALLRRVEPDYEALLASVAGGIVAHAIARTTVGRMFQAQRSAERLVDDLTEYLEQEARLVPDLAARDRFASGVQALLDKAAELEGRLDRAQRRD